jgi:hypothetical protein
MFTIRYLKVSSSKFEVMRSYRETLRRVYVYRASLWLKVVIWAFFPLLRCVSACRRSVPLLTDTNSEVFWREAVFVDAVPELRAYVDLNEITLTADLVF